MSLLRLSLLGQISIVKEAEPIVGFKSSKAVAMLCYLAVTGQICARLMLNSLLWSEFPENNPQGIVAMPSACF